MVVRIQRLAPLADCCDDFVRVLDPAEGLWFWLDSLTKRLIAACMATMEWNTPLLSLRWVSLADKSSTASIHDEEGGVQAKVKRSC